MIAYFDLESLRARGQKAKADALRALQDWTATRLARERAEWGEESAASWAARGVLAHEEDIGVSDLAMKLLRDDGLVEEVNGLWRLTPAAMPSP